MSELPKTYWENLTEEEKINFFDFYMYFVSDETRNPCADFMCPNPKMFGLHHFIINIKPQDHNMCRALFDEKNIHTKIQYSQDGSHWGCPCHIYGHEAFLALEKALIEAGWIEED